MRFVLLFAVGLFLAACSNNPGPTQPPPEDLAQAKADAKARDEFAKSLPKPPER